MTEITDDSVPAWSRGVRTKYDEARGRWMILGPERILVPDGPGADIARLVDGTRSVDDIAAELAREYDADEQTIRDDAIEFLQKLADKGYLHG